MDNFILFFICKVVDVAHLKELFNSSCPYITQYY